MDLRSLGGFGFRWFGQGSDFQSADVTLVMLLDYLLAFNIDASLQGSLYCKMRTLGLCLVIEICLAFGISGLIWPTKLMPIFEVLIFPWPATGRAVRTNSLTALGVAALLFVSLLTSPR